MTVFSLFDSSNLNFTKDLYKIFQKLCRMDFKTSWGIYNAGCHVYIHRQSICYYYKQDCVGW